MGTYIYEQTKKTLEIQHPCFKEPITANIAIYYTKPYWDLWTGALPMNAIDRKIVAGYKRKWAWANKREVNTFLVLLQPSGTYFLYHWAYPLAKSILFPDSCIGDSLAFIGEVTKQGKVWSVYPIDPSQTVVNS